MDAFLAIVSKREQRSYELRRIAPEVERRILEAGRLSGSSRNRQSRRFVVVLSDEVRRETAASVYLHRNVLDAALVIAIVVAGKGPTALDAGRAAQNMMLAAHNDGVGSCPNGIADTERLRGALHLADEESVATVLTFGYPGRPRNPDRRAPQEWIELADRKPFDEVVSEL